MKNLFKSSILVFMTLFATVMVSCDSEDDLGVTELTADFSGFWITNSSGDTEVDDVELTYYEGNNTLVIDGFTYSPAMSAMAGETILLVVSELSESDILGVQTIAGADISVPYTFFGSEDTGTITTLTCECLSGTALLYFTFETEGMSGTISSYPCKYFGDITISTDSYISSAE